MSETDGKKQKVQEINWKMFLFNILLIFMNLKGAVYILMDWESMTSFVKFIGICCAICVPLSISQARRYLGD